MPTKPKRPKKAEAGELPDPADPTTWRVTVEIDPSPRTVAQDRAWDDFWKYAVAELQRRRASRN